MRITPRSGWNARPPKKTVAIHLPSPRLWLHHSAVEWHGPAGVRRTQDFHMDTRGWNDIAYSFLTDDNGGVYEGRGAGIAGGHTEGDNSSSHAICAMGDFTKRQPSDEMVSAIVELVVHGHRAGWWPNHITGGHRDAPRAQTACPGDRLARLIPEINRRVALRLAPSAPQEDLLMAAAHSDHDARWALVLQWFVDYLGRVPRNAAEHDFHVNVFTERGAGACLSGLVNCDEAVARRAA